MDEERKYPDPPALSEAPRCVDQENPAVSWDGMVLSGQGEGSEIVPEEADGVIDSALEGFGEFFDDNVRERVHPVLGALRISPYDTTPEETIRIGEAVKVERKRAKAKAVPEPDTELGKQIKAQLDMPASIVNRHFRNETKKLLEKSKPKGKLS